MLVRTTRKGMRLCWRCEIRPFAKTAKDGAPARLIFGFLNLREIGGYMNHAQRYFTVAVVCFMLFLLAGWAPVDKAKKLSSTGTAKTAAPAASANDQLINANMQEMLDQGRQT